MNTRSSDMRPLNVGRYLPLLLVAIIAGTLGGLVSRSLAGQESSVGVIHSNEIVVPPEGIVFRTIGGKPAAKLSVENDGGVLVIYSANGRPAATLGSVGNEGLISVGNSQGPAVKIFSYENGGAVSLISSKYGKKVVELAADIEGGSLSINGPNGEPTVAIENTSDKNASRGSIDILESIGGKVLWSAPVSKRPK